MMRAVDLHTHSYYSDGSMSPEEIVKLAVKIDLAAIALTDHDTIEGVKEASAAAKEAGLGFIPGIEFSSDYKGRDIHILGLGIDVENAELQDFIKMSAAGRDNRNRRMVEKMNEAGIDVTFEELEEKYHTHIFARPHFAKYLLEIGYVDSLKEAFDKYIGPGMKFYESKPPIAPKDVIETILNAGGVPVLAHPLNYRLFGEELEKMIREFISYGLQGIEVYHSSNAAFDEVTVKELAEKYNLKKSGGSDFHGDRKPGVELGKGKNNVFVPERVIEELGLSKWT